MLTKKSDCWPRIKFLTESLWEERLKLSNYLNQICGILAILKGSYCLTSKGVLLEPQQAPHSALWTSAANVCELATCVAPKYCS